jgi:hypothetical protein
MRHPESGYFPDFIVKNSDSEYFVVETRGMENLDVPISANLKCGSDIIECHSEEVNNTVCQFAPIFRPTKNLSAGLEPEILRSPWFQSTCRKISSIQS